MNKDYKEFIESPGKNPPAHLDQKVFSMVNGDLNPEYKLVFAKLLTVQTFIGVLTLLFCPQFNFSLTNNFDLFHYFHHRFGEQICMIICGSIFIGSGAIFAATLFSLNEIKIIRKHRLLTFITISGLAVASFLIFGAEVYLSLIPYWFFGAVFSGITFMEINFFIRHKLKSI